MKIIIRYVALENVRGVFIGDEGFRFGVILSFDDEYFLQPCFVNDGSDLSNEFMDYCRDAELVKAVGEVLFEYEKVEKSKEYVRGFMDSKGFENMGFEVIYTNFKEADA